MEDNVELKVLKKEKDFYKEMMQESTTKAEYYIWQSKLVKMMNEIDDKENEAQ